MKASVLWSARGCARLLFTAGVRAADETPDPAKLERVLQAGYDRPASSIQPKSVLTLDSVRFGKPYRTTAQQEVQVEEIPNGATVTPAVVDFSVRTCCDCDRDIRQTPHHL